MSFNDTELRHLCCKVRYLPWLATRRKRERKLENGVIWKLNWKVQALGMGKIVPPKGAFKQPGERPACVRQSKIARYVPSILRLAVENQLSSNTVSASAFYAKLPSISPSFLALFTHGCSLLQIHHEWPRTGST